MFREKWLVVVSVVLGLLAASGFYIYSTGMIGGSGKTETKKPVKVKTVKRLMAAKDIAMRTQITEDMISLVEVPEGFAHPESIAEPAEAVGRVTYDRIAKGELLLERNLKSGDTPSDLSFVLPEGMRGITLAASVTGAVGYLVKPGDMVDIVVYLNEKIAEKDVSFTLLRSMSVLATDMKIYGEDADPGMMEKVGGSNKKGETYQSVTIAATPEQCVKLNLAESVGKLKMVLHAPETGEGESADVFGDVISVEDLKKQAGLLKEPEEPEKKVYKPRPKTASSKTAITVEKVEKPEPEEPKEDEPEMRAISILRGTELETVISRAGEGENAKRGDSK